LENIVIYNIYNNICNNIYKYNIYNNI